MVQAVASAKHKNIDGHMQHMLNVISTPMLRINHGHGDDDAPWSYDISFGSLSISYAGVHA